MQKNRESRRRKIKTKASSHHNPVEMIKSVARKKMRRRELNEAELLATSNDISVVESEDEETTTHLIYSELMKDPDFLLSMQPKMYENSSSEDEDAAVAPSVSADMALSMADGKMSQTHSQMMQASFVNDSNSNMLTAGRQAVAVPSGAEASHESRTGTP